MVIPEGELLVMDLHNLKPSATANGSDRSPKQISRGCDHKKVASGEAKRNLWKDQIRDFRTLKECHKTNAQVSVALSELNAS